MFQAVYKILLVDDLAFPHPSCHLVSALLVLVPELGHQKPFHLGLLEDQCSAYSGAGGGDVVVVIRDCTTYCDPRSDIDMVHYRIEDRTPDIVKIYIDSL